MSPRTKRRASALARKANVQQNKATVPTSEHLPPQVTPPGPRRSTRRTASPRKAATEQDKGAATIPYQGYTDKMNQKSTSAEKSAEKGQEKGQKKKIGAEREVASAVQSLEEMEMTFKRDIKKRKLQVEESFISPTVGQGEGVAKDALTPSIKGKSDVIRPERDPLSPDHERQIPDSRVDESDISGPETGELVELREQDESPQSADRGAKRPPAVNSDYLPLPWKGRLGYACLNTYLRAAKPPVFCSRTCRIASIIEHRFPLADPSMPEHSTKNRPDKEKKPDHALGQKYVENLGLANARDIVKMLRWNDEYGIKFMRLSSEMFPFASHEEYGYKLAPFASDVLAEAGKVAAELGHRVTTHPGQFTQLGSPRKEVVTAAIRDLEYHNELLSLLQLPPQQDRDAVMILHMGGIFNDAGGKPATLDRFRKNYATLSSSIKRRLVLENDDVAWSVYDLLPICEELNIPLVLDYHHHNIVFDVDKIREGTYDISQPDISERIANTWKRKGIKQKMHYSEPCAGTVSPRDRRKHSARVMTLPPCPPDTDLMIEAKDKEQAVFDLMKRFKLPGFEKIADVVAHEREDQDRPPVQVKQKKASPKKRKTRAKDQDQDERTNGENEDEPANVDGGLKVSAEDFGMGGPLGRVYWPIGFEEWLMPKKRERKPKLDLLDGTEM